MNEKLRIGAIQVSNELEVNMTIPEESKMTPEFLSL